MRWSRTMRFEPIDNCDGTHSIPLGDERFALVDSVDLGKLSHCCWHASKSKKGKTHYAKGRATGTLVAVGMHRVILCFPLLMIDHINGNGLDNRRCNLRLATARQNNLNHVRSANKTSRFRGVHKCKDAWSACIKFNYRLINLGMYVNEIDAAAAYDIAAQKLNQDFAVLNRVPAKIDVRLRVGGVLRECF